MSAARKVDSSVKSNAQVISQKSDLVVGTDYSRSLVSGEFSSSELLDCALSFNVMQICQPLSSTYLTDLKLSTLMLDSPSDFINFPISAILDPESVSSEMESQLTIFNKDFCRADEKQSVLGEINKILLSRGMAKSLVSDVALAADEMFTNAVFNAPFVDLATGKNPGMDRNDDTTTMSGRQGTIFVGMDDNRVVIGCSDPFGTLNINHLLTRVKSCCDTGVSGNIQMGSGGAGIGTYLIFNLSSGFYVAVHPGQATVVCCTLQWRLGSRKRSEIPKSLHCIIL